MVVIYDTTKPSGPIKAITLDASMGGDIVSLVCSPFSKTLCAVATGSGHIALIDIEKDKSFVYQSLFDTTIVNLWINRPFRTIPLKTPLTCLSFSPEGASIYVGTENGKVHIIDLRALDAPAKAINVGENGERVINICVQASHF